MPTLGCTCSCPRRVSDPSRPLDRWQLWQCHVRGREGRPGAAGRPALCGDPAGLGAELHVRPPSSPGLQCLRCLCSLPFPQILQQGPGSLGSAAPLCVPGVHAFSAGLSPAWVSQMPLEVCAGPSWQHLGAREGTPCAPSLPRALRASYSAMEDEDKDVASLRAASHPRPLDPLLTHSLALTWGDPGWGLWPPRPLRVQCFRVSVHLELAGSSRLMALPGFTGRKSQGWSVGGRSQGADALLHGCMYCLVSSLTQE